MDSPKRFINGNFVAYLFTTIFLALFLFAAYQINPRSGQPDNPVSAITTIFFCAIFLGLVVSCLTAFQMTTLNKDGIVVRNLLSVVQRKTWAQIRHIEAEQLTFFGQHTRVFTFLVFQDGNSRVSLFSSRIRKDSAIILKESRRLDAAVEKILAADNRPGIAQSPESETNIAYSFGTLHRMWYFIPTMIFIIFFENLSFLTDLRDPQVLISLVGFLGGAGSLLLLVLLDRKLTVDQDGVAVYGAFHHLIREKSWPEIQNILLESPKSFGKRLFKPRLVFQSSGSGTSAGSQGAENNPPIRFKYTKILEETLRRYWKNGIVRPEEAAQIRQ